MINRILNLGSAALLYFSMATVASILMIATVLWSRSYFTGDRAFQMRRSGGQTGQNPPANQIGSARSLDYQ
jgi:hypothetical protein